MKWYIGLTIGLCIFNMLQGIFVAAILRKKAATFGKKPNYFFRGAADMIFLIKKVKTDKKSFSSKEKCIINYSKVVYSIDVIIAITFITIWIYYSLYAKK